MSEKKCFWCDGSGIEGYDRSYPPNEIICPLCDGKKKITVGREKLAEFLCDLIYPDKAKIHFIGAISALQYLDGIIYEYSKGELLGQKSIHQLESPEMIIKTLLSALKPFVARWENLEGTKYVQGHTLTTKTSHYQKATKIYNKVINRLSPQQGD